MVLKIQSAHVSQSSGKRAESKKVALCSGALRKMLCVSHEQAMLMVCIGSHTNERVTGRTGLSCRARSPPFLWDARQSIRLHGIDDEHRLQQQIECRRHRSAGTNVGRASRQSRNQNTCLTDSQMLHCIFPAGNYISNHILGPTDCLL